MRCEFPVESTDFSCFCIASVSRLELELRSYQAKYPIVLTDSQLNDVANESPPWIVNAQYLSPLLQAYDDRVKELRLENIKHKVSSISSGACYSCARITFRVDEQQFF
jgi:hypothetical protein